MPLASNDYKIIPTSAATLRKYGMTQEEWLAIVKEQNNCCAICRQVPKSGKLVVDHFHVRGWKKMKPAERRLYVRGVVCHFCNIKCVSRWATIERAINVINYLRKYQEAFDARNHKPTTD